MTVDPGVLILGAAWVGWTTVRVALTLPTWTRIALWGFALALLLVPVFLGADGHVLYTRGALPLAAGLAVAEGTFEGLVRRWERLKARLTGEAATPAPTPPTARPKRTKRTP